MLDDSAKEAFDGQPVLFTHSGGSIPFMNLLRQKFPESLFMVTGLVGPGANMHAGMENIYLPMLKKLLHGLTKFTEKFTNYEF